MIASTDKRDALRISSIAFVLALLLSSWGFGQTSASSSPKVATQLPTACTWKDDDSASYRLEYLQKNLELCREIGNKMATAGILRIIGSIHSYARRHDEAINALRESISVSEEANDTPSLVRSLAGLGDVYTRNDDFDNASHFLEKALALSEQFGDKLLLAQTLRPFNTFLGKQYRTEEALRFAQRRLALFTELGRDKDVKQEAVFLASLYGSTGDYQKALEYHQRVLANYQERGDDSLVAGALSNIGAFYYTQGFPEQSLDYFERSFELHKKTSNGGGSTFVASWLEAVHKSLGDSATATKYSKLVLDSYLEDLKNTSDKRTRAYALWRIAPRYKAVGDLEQARKGFEEIVTFTSTINDKNWFTAALEQLARLEDDVGNVRLANELYQRSLDVCEGVNSFEIELILRCVRTYTHLAERSRNEGEEKRALRMVEQAERVSRKRAANDWISHKNNQLVGKAYHSLSQYEKAQEALERFVFANESDGNRFLGDTDRLKFLSSLQEAYELYFDVLMNLYNQRPFSDYNLRAFNTNERNRARLLFDLLSEKNLIIREGVDTELLERERVIQRKLNELVGRQSRSQLDPASEQASALQRDIRVLMSEHEQVRSLLRTKCPRYTNLSQPTALTAERIQRELLDHDTILLEYSLGEKKSYLWSVTRNSIRSYELSNRNEIETAARQVYELLQDGQRWTDEVKTDAEYAEVAGKLSEMLLGPVAEQIKRKRLVIVADGAMQYIPFSALPSPKSKSQGQQPAKAEPLALTNEIASLPSASVLSVLRSEAASRKQKGKGIAVIADPVFSETDERLVKNGAAANGSEKGDLNRIALERAFNSTDVKGKPFSIPRLPFTRREAESIFSSAPKTTSIKSLDFEADREKILKTDLAKYRIVHFATHGILHSEYPELSGIVLSLVNEKGEPINGFLRLNEIYNMKLNADLVVLSACQTALGKEIRGEGLIGLTRGFMYAGTPRVVASLWKVDDVATGELMKVFYEKMLKESMRPAAALRAAKIEMIRSKRWSAPYYWAAFELQGDWR